jgi:hypothetical protein
MTLSMYNAKLQSNIFYSITDDSKGFPTLLVATPIASAFTILLVLFVVWWRRKRRVVGKFCPGDSISLLFS